MEIFTDRGGKLVVRNSWQEVRLSNFKEHEFTMGSENVLDKMDIPFLQKLDALRTACGFSMTLNSTFRSMEYNKSIGGSSTSMHLLGRAADIKCNFGSRRVVIVREAIKLGLSVGPAKTFVHVDNRETQILFVY